MSVLTVTLHPSLDRVLRGDCLRPNDSTRTRLVMEYAGGKGNNAARALVRLGAQVTATGFQGGASGQMAVCQLVSEGVDTRFVRCASSTRISTMLHEESTGLTFAIYETGQKVTRTELRALLVLFRELVGFHEIVLLCGSAQTKILESVFSKMIKIAQAQKVATLLDSSENALKLGILAKPDLVKVNQQELEGIFEKPLSNRNDQVCALLELCQSGVHIAALTLGQDGMIATDGTVAWQGKLKMPHVTNTVGCGDATLAGMAYSLTQKADLAEVVRWGTACGAANTQCYGAGFITKERVTKLLPLVLLEKLTQFMQDQELSSGKITDHRS